MKRSYVVAGAMLLGLFAQAAEGKHIAKATLQTRAGATVASAQADPNGTVRFMNVPPGEYQLVLTNADGRSITVADLDGDGQADIVIEGRGAGSGKVNMQDLSMTKSPAPGASAGGKSPGGALPGGAVISAGVVAPRDSATGMATGKRMHKPYVCLMDWDLATNKGGYASERVAQAEGQQLPDNTGGRCVIKVVCDQQPGTIEVQSWSWGMSQQGKHTKTGHVTLMK